jgi:hypothetical protein
MGPEAWRCWERPRHAPRGGAGVAGGPGDEVRRGSWSENEWDVSNSAGMITGSGPHRGGVEAPMAVARRCFLGGDKSRVAGDVRGRALEHQEREESQMHGQIEEGEDQVVELTDGAAMVAVVAPNPAVAAVLRRPTVYER